MKYASATLPSEPALVRQALVDPAAFADLYDHYFPRIWNYVRYRVDSSPVTDDLTSGIFERALKKLHTYDPAKAPFPAWLFGIARNAITDYYRSRQRRRWLSLDVLGERSDDAPGSAEMMGANESKRELLEALGGLSERERDVLGLKFGALMGNRRIAEMTGLSDSNVGVIIYRAVGKLRDRPAAKGQTGD